MVFLSLVPQQSNPVFTLLPRQMFSFDIQELSIDSRKIDDNVVPIYLSRQISQLTCPMPPAVQPRKTSEKCPQWHLTPERFCSALHQKYHPPGQCLPHLHIQKTGENKKRNCHPSKETQMLLVQEDFLTLVGIHHSQSTVSLSICLNRFVCRASHTYYIVSSYRAEVILNHLCKSQTALISLSLINTPRVCTYRRKQISMEQNR